jgi:putative oxidoreductase
LANRSIYYQSSTPSPEFIFDKSSKKFKLEGTKNDCHMNNTSISRIGTIIYALVIGFFGVNHFLHGTGLQNTVPRFIPYSKFFIYVTGALLIAAAVSFLINKYVRVAGILLAIFLLLIVLTVHVPAMTNLTGDEHVSIIMTNLVKDTGLAGAALIIAGKGS